MSTAVIAINGVIGDARHGVSADAVIEELTTAAFADSLVIRIDSTGGDVFEAAAIFNAIRQHAAREKTSIVRGPADSAASWLALAADRVLVSANASFFVHNPASTPETGMSGELLNRMKSTIAGLYASKTGDPIGLWVERMNAGLWLNASQAIDVGLADGWEQQ